VAWSRTPLIMKASDFFSLRDLVYSAARSALGVGIAVAAIGGAIWGYVRFTGGNTDKAVALTLVFPFILIAILGSVRVWLSRRELQASVGSHVGALHLGFAAAWAAVFASASSVSEYLVASLGVSGRPVRGLGEYVFNVVGFTGLCLVIAALPMGRR